MIPKNTIIALLLLSATILSCILFFQLVLPGSQSALAIGGGSGVSGGRAGSLSTATATFKTDEDALWIADGSTQMLIVCETTASGKIKVTADKDLAKVFDDKKGRK